MKLAHLERVETLHPPVTIGRRVDPLPDGGERTSRTWTARCTFAGKVHYHATGKTNKKAALVSVGEWHRGLTLGEAPAEEVPLARLVDDYMAMQEGKGAAPKTLQKYRYVLKEAREHAEGRDVHVASRYTARDFWDFALSMSELGEKTRHDRLVIVKQLFKWAARVHAIPRDPLSAERLEEPEPTEQPCFTPAQVAQLIAAAEPHLRPIITTLAYTGMRFGELRDLRWEDVDLKSGAHGFITVRRGGSTGKTKNRKSRRIPVHPELRPVLAALPRRDERVFPAPPTSMYPDGGGPLKERWLINNVKRLCRKCKFSKPDQYKIHTFRHAFASMLAREQVSHRYALEFMGHSSSEILDLYYKMYDDAAEQAIGKIAYACTAIRAA